MSSFFLFLYVVLACPSLVSGQILIIYLCMDNDPYNGFVDTVSGMEKMSLIVQRD